MPTHGDLARSNAALLALTRIHPAPAEIIIVTDSPSAGPDHPDLPAGARLVHVPFASGPARARNAGAAIATGEILLFVDSDVEVPPQIVWRILAEFDSQPSVQAVFGSYDASPADPGFLSQYRNLLHHYVHQRSAGIATTFWAGLGAIRSNAFRQVGGFNPAFSKPSVEDIELGYRMHAAGMPIRLARHIQAKHHKRWTAWGMLSTDLWCRGVPWMELILDRGGAPPDLNLRWGHRASVALAWAMALLAVATTVWPTLGFAALAAAALLTTVNSSFYRFLASRRGPLFALASIPWHALHYLECGLAVGIGLSRHLLRRARMPGFNSRTE